MNVARQPTVGSYSLHPLSAAIAGDFNTLHFPLLLSPTNAFSSSNLNSKFSSKASLKCRCTKNDITPKPIQGFSVLAPDCIWKSGSIWSTMALYMFNLHFPLGYGGLSIVASLLHQPVLDPQTQVSAFLWVHLSYCGIQLLQHRKKNMLHGILIKAEKGMLFPRPALEMLLLSLILSGSYTKLDLFWGNISRDAVSLLMVQMLELSGTLFLLTKNIKPQYGLVNFFKTNKMPKERNWFLASALGSGFLILLVLLTSLLADRLLGVKAVNNPMVKEILLSSNISKTAFVLVTCIITPVLEEAIYRGFLLTSLASTMDWKHAVVISSAIFSAAHFSGQDFIQLFVVGCVFGCSYSWSGNLTSSIVIHSLYNASILVILTILS